MGLLARFRAFIKDPTGSKRRAIEHEIMLLEADKAREKREREFFQEEYEKLKDEARKERVFPSPPKPEPEPRYPTPEPEPEPFYVWISQRPDKHSRTDSGERVRIRITGIDRDDFNINDWQEDYRKRALSRGADAWNASFTKEWTP